MWPALCAYSDRQQVYSCFLTLAQYLIFDSYFLPHSIAKSAAAIYPWSFSYRWKGGFHSLPPSGCSSSFSSLFLDLLLSPNCIAGVSVSVLCTFPHCVHCASAGASAGVCTKLALQTLLTLSALLCRPWRPCPARAYHCKSLSLSFCQHLHLPFAHYYYYYFYYYFRVLVCLFFFYLPIVNTTDWERERESHFVSPSGVNQTKPKSALAGQVFCFLLWECVCVCVFSADRSQHSSVAVQ